MHNCKSGIDEAGVICTGEQMCYNGEWHSVCGDRWSEMGSEADVVCSTLGYAAELGKEVKWIQNTTTIFF